MYEIRDHPDAPDFAELGEFVVEPVAPDEIRERRDAGDELHEENLLEADGVDAYVHLDPDPMEPTRSLDIGIALYRLVQLFGTPQFPEYMAGNDISWREDEVFKFLLEVTREEADDRWLITVHDYKVSLGVSLAAWNAAPDVDTEEAVALLSLVTNVVDHAVECEYADKPY